MAEKGFLKVLYIVFLGALIATFIGVGVSTFYEGPKEPQRGAAEDLVINKDGTVTEEDRARAAKIDAENRTYYEALKSYSQTVSIILLLLAVALVAASIFIEMKSSVFSNGIMLGGLITLMHSIIRGAIAGNKMYLFIATTVSLAVVAYLGYRHFVRPKTAAK